MTAGYTLLLVPLWQVRALVWTGRGRLVFLTALVAGILRLHLWFADDLHPTGRWEQQTRSRTAALTLSARRGVTRLNPTTCSVSKMAVTIFVRRSRR